MPRKSRQKEKLGRKGFLLNEPEKMIRGGRSRESTLLSSTAVSPQIRRRQELDLLLTRHCPPADIIKELKAEDEALLHQMAHETIVTGASPAIRKRAIWALRSFPTPATVNLLTELGQHGEDAYIRSEALGSLGAFGLRLSLPLLSKSLSDPSSLVRNAAVQGIRSCARALGEDVVAHEVGALRRDLSRPALKRLFADPRRRGRRRLRQPKKD